MAVKGSQEFHDAVEDLLKDTPYKKPIGEDHECLYGRVRSAIQGRHPVDNALMKVTVKEGQIINIERVNNPLAEIVEEFVGWWHLNREGSVNRTYDYVDKIIKRMRGALEEER